MISLGDEALYVDGFENIAQLCNVREGLKECDWSALEIDKVHGETGFVCTRRHGVADPLTTASRLGPRA